MGVLDKVVRKAGRQLGDRAQPWLHDGKPRLSASDFDKYPTRKSATGMEDMEYSAPEIGSKPPSPGSDKFDAWQAAHKKGGRIKPEIGKVIGKMSTKRMDKRGR